MSIKAWLKNQMMAAAMAVSSVEKNTFGQQGTNLGLDIKQEKKHDEGTLLASLKQGKITQEVRDLRWRTYKVLQASENFKLKFVKEDEDGDAIYEVVPTLSGTELLKKIKVDPSDYYELEMVLNNAEIALDTADAMGNNSLTIYDKVRESTILNQDGEKDEKDGFKSIAHGEMSANDLSMVKCIRPMRVEHSNYPKFYIENFTTKLNIRKISESEKLLEFYVSKYPDEYRPTSRLFINKIKKALEAGVVDDNLLTIDEVGFITDNTVGSPNFLCFGYKINGFHRIVEYEGYYIIKYKADVIISGVNVLAEFVEAGLDKRYENKEVRKQRI